MSTTTPVVVQIFGTVCLDKVRIIDEFPKVLGTFTTVSKEINTLGGEATNSFVILSDWIKELVNGKQQQQQLSLENVILISSPLVNDITGQLIKKRLESYPNKYLTIVEPSDDCILKITNTTDLYICNLKERTMFGIGFIEMDQYLYDNRDQFLKNIKFGPEYWISLDFNTPLISKVIMDKAIETKTNLYVMDQELFLNDSHHNQENIQEMNIVYQTSTDFFGNKGDRESILQSVRQWLDNGNQKHCFIIVTDSKNGYAIGGQLYNKEKKQKEFIQVQWRESITLDPSLVQDTTGAGDSFRAGFLYSFILNQSSLNDSLLFASISGAFNCRYLTGCD
ncbi:hypothetical protein CYY_003978, partial [Polysphondylium violaceum]